MNGLSKIVVSRTLEKAEWANTRLSLNLLKSRPFNSGNVLLYYQPAPR